jgi:hypothetical protein
LQDTVGEPRREADTLALRRAVYVAPEVRRQPDGDISFGRRVDLQVEFSRACCGKVSALEKNAGEIRITIASLQKAFTDNFDFDGFSTVISDVHRQSVADGLVSCAEVGENKRDIDRPSL